MLHIIVVAQKPLTKQKFNHIRKTIGSNVITFEECLWKCYQTLFSLDDKELP